MRAKRASTSGIRSGCVNTYMRSSRMASTTILPIFARGEHSGLVGVISRLGRVAWRTSETEGTRPGITTLTPMGNPASTSSILRVSLRASTPCFATL